MKYSTFAMRALIGNLREKAMRKSTPQKIAGTMYEAAEAIEQLMDTQPRWIPVSERLPKDDEMVLAVVDAKTDTITFLGAVEPAVWCPEEGWILDAFPEADVERVTHWMPVPDAPEVE